MTKQQRPPRQPMALAVIGCAVVALIGCSRATATTATSASTGSPVANSTAVSTGTEPSSTTGPLTSAPSTTPVGTTPPPTTTAPTDPAAPVGTPTATLPPVPNQRAAIGYEHPQLGPVTISLSYPEQSDSNVVPTVRATVNATGKTVFEWTGEDGYLQFGFAGASLNPDIKNPVDGRGHVFFEYDPGRFPGVSYLIPTATGFDSNGTMGDSYDSGHYLANVDDSDGDGNYEIEQGFQVCTPSCADGYSYSHTWTWDGSAYTGSDVDPNLSGEQTAQKRAAAKKAFTEYLLAAGAREYKRAWAMLTPSYQDDYGSYAKFTKFWDGIASVGTNWITPGAINGSSTVAAGTSLDVDIWFETTDGRRQTETVGVVMTNDDPPKIAEYTSYGAHD